jgi:multidrug efflux pump subunit AcrA (membrane-fusion protein)
MKIIGFILILVLVIGAAVFWHSKQPAAAAPAMPAGMDMSSTSKGGRKILYYQSAMHPWIKSPTPGKCPICGMDLVPVYEGDAKASTDTNGILLTASSITAVNVQTETVQRRPIVHTLHVIGRVMKNSSTAAWFVFDIYESDLPWIKPGQMLELTLPAVPDRIYRAQIKLHGKETFADRDLDDASDSTKIRAEIENPPVEMPGFEGKAYFNNLHAESDIHAATPEVLAVPRSAVLYHGREAMVYIADGGGHYTSKPVTLGRVGDEYYEVRAGLDEGDVVVTHGALLIDAEAQLSAGR